MQLLRRSTVAIWLLLTACGGSDAGIATSSPAVADTPTTSTPTTAAPQATTSAVATACPEVIRVEFTPTAPGVFTIAATVRSTDIEGVSYADAWEVRSPAGEVLGTRELTHPHPNEQPFTRSLTGVSIPGDVAEVEVAARDSVRGYCGPSLAVEVPSP